MIRVIETQFFGPVVAFAGISQVKEVRVEAQERWQKMSYRNRCQVLTQGGVKYISLPVKGGRDQHAAINEVELEVGDKWKRENWRTLESAYNCSPFFAHYAQSLLGLLMQPNSRLLDFNRQCLAWVLQQLNWKGQITRTGSFESLPQGDLVVDQRGQFFPRNRTAFPLPAYPQSFGTHFESNLSVLDLLFQLGPEALLYLDKIPVTIGLPSSTP